MYPHQRQHHYAGFWARVLEHLIDLLAVALVSALLNSLIWIQTYRALKSLHMGHAQWLNTIQILICLVVSAVILLGVSVFNFVVLQKINGQTIGKRILGHQLVQKNGFQLTWRTVIARYCATFLSHGCFELGFIMIVLTKRKRALHDILCGTLVVRKI